MRPESFCWPCNLSASAKIALLKPAKTLVLERNDPLVFGREGKNGLFYVLHGLVTASMRNPTKPCPFALLKAGDWGGALTVRKDMKLYYQLVGIERSTIVFIPNHAVIECLEAHVELYKFLYVLTTEVEQRIIDMLYASSSMKLTQKVAYLLLEASKSFPTIEGAKPMISMSQTMLAQVLGLSRISLNNQLHLLEQRNAIDIDRKAIYIRDISLLKKIADG